jgi:hypothetical protein
MTFLGALALIIFTPVAGLLGMYLAGKLMWWFIKRTFNQLDAWLESPEK